jgi:hypothetical protein
MHKGRSSVSVAAFVVTVLAAGLAAGGITLVKPEVTVTEGDRVVSLSWSDPNPEMLVYLEEPRLGSTQYPWRGKATVSLQGFYTGACDWTYEVSLVFSAESTSLFWSEVADWRTQARVGRRLRLEDTDFYYNFSDGIKIAIPSSGLFLTDLAGWSGPQPGFNGIYRGGGVADTVVRYTFTCTSGGDLSLSGGAQIDLAWTNGLGESGSFAVSRAGDNVAVHKGLKVTFPAGSFTAGQGFLLDAMVPFGRPITDQGLPADGFRVRALTFEGYMVLRRSVEDRAATPGDTLFKVIADLSRCRNPEFFADATGQQAPESTRYFMDHGIPGGTVGVTPDSTANTVLNGFPYKYAVLTYDWSDDYRLLTCDTTWTQVFPSVTPMGKTVENVHVVPNPYLFRAGWEQAEAKVQFVNVPLEAVIWIYDAAGDHVGTVRPNQRLDGSQAGTADWNLRDTNGEQVVSGIYIYKVEARGASKTGRFIVVR